ncbi:uncharacterized protein TNCV_1277741 [Trichonephila clavipes]|nr:uncharacterized protein TNCV_1277741 [Trichonephila clavipes]
MIKFVPTFSEPIRHTTPEGCCQKFYEGSDSDEKPALRGVHAHLLEIDSQQREQRPESGEKEEVEGFGDQQVLVEVGAQTVDDVPL